MFTQRCFIRKNTPELRKRLKALGYECRQRAEKYDNLRVEFVTSSCYSIPNRFLKTIDVKKQKHKMDFGIDCGENEELFIAIAALRDDSDYMQWFVTEANQSWVNIGTYANKGSFELCLTTSRYPEEWKGSEQFCSSVDPAHKASVEELKEHFK